MDKGAKVTGLLVFVAGVAMLIAVFVVALNMLNESRTAQVTDVARQLPTMGFALLARVLFLFVLGYIASAVAARGIQMFESCGSTEKRAGISQGARQERVVRDEPPNE